MRQSLKQEVHGSHRSPGKQFQWINTYEQEIERKKYLLFENWTILICKNEYPSPKDALCQVRLKLALWFWRRFLLFINEFSLFHYYFLFKKGVAFHLHKHGFTKFGWNWSTGSWKEDKNGIFFKRRWQTTDKSSLDRSAQVSLKGNP